MPELDVLLMLRGESRHCPGCATETIFLPVEGDSPEAWCCTACDSAVAVPVLEELRAA